MILLTGASEGIGLACAHALLLRTGEQLLITGRHRRKLDRAVEGLPPNCRDRMLTKVSDQSQRDDVDALVEHLERVPDVTGAILTVGVNPLYREGARRIHLVGAKTIEETIRTNCTHTLLIARALLARFHEQGSGVLVWVGSRAAAGFPGAAVYSASKSFLSGLAWSASQEYARHGVRVHLVHPGVVRTPRTSTTADNFAARHGVPVADPSDTARAIIDLFLGGAADCVEVSLE